MRMNVFRTLLILWTLCYLGSGWTSAAFAGLTDGSLSSPITIQQSSEATGLNKAVDDLASDLRKTLGGQVSIAPKGQADVKVGIDASLDAPESWRIAITKDQVKIVGADELGAIYGVYEFSKRFLGVDPLWFWKGIDPVRREGVKLPPQTLQSKQAVFRYRGWFINDEDLLTEWKNGGGRRYIRYPFYSQVIHLDVADRVFEALLRSGGNLIIPASFVDVMNPPEAALVKRAAERGLYVTQHHIEPLGVSHFGFENYWDKRGQKVKFLYGAEPEKVREVWRAHAKKWRDLCGDRVVWQLGLRGKGDAPIWAHDKSVKKEEAGAFISQAIADQYQIACSVDPRPNPPATSTLWLEASKLMQEYKLSFPPGITIVFADNGHNQMLQRDFHESKRQPHHTYGMYYHIAFWAAGSHLVQGTRPEKLKRNFDALITKGDTHYAIINVSNVREHVLGITAAMEIMQQGSAWNQQDFFTRFAPPVLHESYRRFLGSLIEMPHDRLMQDGACWEWIRDLAKELERGAKQLPGKFAFKDAQGPEAVADRLAGSIIQLNRVASDHPGEATPLEQRPFFDYHVRTQALMLSHYYGCVRELVLSFDEPTRLRNAVAELDQLLEVRERAATGRWENWYRGDKKENIPNVRAMLHKLANNLNGAK